MSRDSMRRGAAEANAESDRLADARDMGEAIGKLAAFASIISRLGKQVDELEKRVALLEGGPVRYAAPVSAPPGWKLVPKEPTPEMCAAAAATPGIQAVNEIIGLHSIRTGGTREKAEDLEPWPGNGTPLEQAYRAMLAATPAQAAPVAEPLIAVMREVFREIEEREGGDGNAPGHGHEVAGIWDADNGARSGKPCEWCALWNRAKAMLAAAPTTGADETKEK